MLLSNLKPAVSKNFLMAIAGLMWSGVGVMLCILAVKWMRILGLQYDLLISTSGIMTALVVYYFGFSKIAVKNIKRLSSFQDKICLFAFQAWKSYLIILVMICLGIFLRHLPIHKYYLSIPYLTIGGALFLSSLHYYVQIWREKTGSIH